MTSTALEKQNDELSVKPLLTCPVRGAVTAARKCEAVSDESPEQEPEEGGNHRSSNLLLVSLLPRTGDNIHAHHRLAVTGLLQPGLVANTQLTLGLFGLLQHARRMLLFLAGPEQKQEQSSWTSGTLVSLDPVNIGSLFTAFPVALRYFNTNQICSS